MLLQQITLQLCNKTEPVTARDLSPCMCCHQMADEPEACSADTFDSAFTKAFLKTDEEFGKADNAALVGTTAVVALVGDRQLYIGNCGALQCSIVKNGAKPQQPHFADLLCRFASLQVCQCELHSMVCLPEQA